MPIKLPKAFPRRKSVGNALEEVENPPEPSFRVFERPIEKSFDGGNSLKRMSQARPLSSGFPSDENIYSGRPNTNPSNRGSGGTNNSTSSKYDNSSSSARYSSTSTLPSSTDIPLDEGSSPHPKVSDNIPLPTIPNSSPLSFRAGGRTFSFGRKKAQAPDETPPPIPQHVPDTQGHTRERAFTDSSYASGSTATPPKLLNTSLDLGISDLDGFGSMFDNVGKRTSQVQAPQTVLELPRTESPENMASAGSRMLTKPYGERTVNTPSPRHHDRTCESASSPYSHSSRNSQDFLMSAASPAVPDASFSYRDSPHTQRYHQPSHSQTAPLPHTSSPSGQTRQAGPRPLSGLRRSSGHAAKRDSTPLLDGDARLVMDAVSASQRLNRSSRDFDSYIDSYRDSYGEDDEGFVRQPTISPVKSPTLPLDQSPTGNEWQRTAVELYDVPYRDAPNARRIDSAETTPRAKKLDMAQPEEERSMFDKSPPRLGRPQPPARKPLAPTNASSQIKVMTPAQFEQYRKEQENNRRASIDSGSDESEESDNYDEEDEEERKRELAKERRKQEAHLAVYRQQMMKVTGEQPSDLPSLRPGIEKSYTAPAGRARTPTFIFDKPPGSKASDDEDDEVPLGILAAHGFPAKNRPPTASMANPNIKYQSESYPPPPMSTAGASSSGRPLPPFAKHLPPDPYFGAGLVNSSTRESLGFNHSSAGSAYGGSQGAAHPAGLVGVIAGEERARAARRGSPNAQAGFGTSMPQGMMPPTMGMPPMLSPGDEAQIQMSQQMNQMMQMQMQWMQQMQTMMASGMQPGMQPPMVPPHVQVPGGNNGMLSPQMPQLQQLQMGNGMLSPGQMPRPVSHSAPGSPAAIPNTGPRAMSMMTPTAPPQWGRQSTALSMMSGGIHPLHHQGYTPSIAPSERSNVGMPSRYKPVSMSGIDEGSRPGSSMSMSTAGKLKSTVRPVKKASNDEDDEEEGWEEMKKKRDAKKSNWRKTKDEKGGGLEGIYFPSEQ